jgi:hypothetical protein
MFSALPDVVMLESANRVLPLCELTIMTCVCSAVLIFNTRSASARAASREIRPSISTRLD